jgi:hypothetical protein
MQRSPSIPYCVLCTSWSAWRWLVRSLNWSDDNTPNPGGGFKDWAVHWLRLWGNLANIGISETLSGTLSIKIFIWDKERSRKVRVAFSVW